MTTGQYVRTCGWSLLISASPASPALPLTGTTCRHASTLSLMNYDATDLVHIIEKEGCGSSGAICVDLKAEGYLKGTLRSSCTDLSRLKACITDHYTSPHCPLLVDGLFGVSRGASLRLKDLDVKRTRQSGRAWDPCLCGVPFRSGLCVRA